MVDLALPCWIMERHSAASRNRSEEARMKGKAEKRFIWTGCIRLLLLL